VGSRHECEVPPKSLLLFEPQRLRVSSSAVFLPRGERAGGFYSECLSGGMLFSTGAVAVGH
jgi:hypothetical protein